MKQIMLLMAGCTMGMVVLGCESAPNAGADNALRTTDTNSASLTSTKSGSFHIATESFGETPDGEAVSLFTCTTPSGMVVKLTNYGATITSVLVPDTKGDLANVTLGFDSLDGYLRHKSYFGCTVGRFANRIAFGKFTLDDTEHQLAKNLDPHHLHGGVRGLDRVVWTAETMETDNAVGVRFTYRSPDGDEQYPGNLDVTAEYSLSDDQELKVRYAAKTDKPTVINLTNHAYWNLAGSGNGTILDHELTVYADQYLAVGPDIIPTGELADVSGSALDFREPRQIGERIAQNTFGEGIPVGYDNCYALRNQGLELPLAARVRDPKSKRVMEVFTSQPGIQLYTSNHLNGDEVNGGHPQYAAFCLETQHFPDSPNHPEFPSTVLRPDESFEETTVYKFGSGD